MGHGRHSKEWATLYVAMTFISSQARDSGNRGAVLPAGGAGLNLAGGKAHSEVSDEGVLRLTGTVGSHHTPACRLGVTYLENREDHASVHVVPSRERGYLWYEVMRDSATPPTNTVNGV